MCRKALSRAVSLLLAVVLLVGVLPAMDVSAASSSKSGENCYISVIEKIIADSKYRQGDGYGALYDIDGNGVKELIMTHPGMADHGLSTIACSLYTASNGKAIPLIDAEILIVEAGGPSGHVAVINSDGKYKYAITSETGETGGGPGYIISRYGSWKIYTLQGTSLTLETTVKYDYDRGDEIVYDSSYATFNGRKCSYREYEEWRESLAEIVRVHPYGYNNTNHTMSLEELLEYLKENPVEDSTESGWTYKNGNWYFYENGAPKIGWLKDGGNWYYMDASGVMQTGWEKVGNAWYYFNGSGVMQTGWLKLGSNWYYLNSSGAMVTGTVTINGEQHKFDSSGVWKGKVVQSKNGWVTENGKWYYYKNGTKVTGWVKDGKSWYYMDPSGVMHTGWLALNGKWYYLNSGGAMVTGTVTIDGKQHKFDSSGVWQGEVAQTKNGWVKENGKWYYYENGIKATGYRLIDGNSYCFLYTGEMYTGWMHTNTGAWYYYKPSGVEAVGWCKIDGDYYYFNTSGIAQTGWLKDGGNWYYLDTNTRKMVTGTHVINGVTYKFNSSGVWIG